MEKVSVGIFAIRDLKGDIFKFGNVFACNNVESAKRVFEQMVSANVIMNSHREDFSLYSIGVLDPVSGSVTPMFDLVMHATDFKEVKEDGKI